MMQKNNIYEFDTDFFSSDDVFTEAYAFKLLKENPITNTNYLAIPWSFFINKGALDSIPLHPIKGGFTVCQHIDYKSIIPILKKIGIDTLFTPHASGYVEGIRVLPFCHYAARTAQPSNKKDIFYSFIGFNSTSYDAESGLRNIIFGMNHPKNSVVKQRHFWHWSNKCDWEEERISLNEQEQNGKEYADVLSRSRFSLCPRGRGASTIRFWESLGAGAIPVLISDEMSLPEIAGLNWEDCIIKIPENDISRLQNTLDAVSPREEKAKRKKCLDAYKQFSGENFVKVIREFYDCNELKTGNSTEPFFSVVTAVLNGNSGNYDLERTIKSVLSQTYKNFEIIIVDGGSTDGTMDIVKKYENLENVRWVSEKDAGIYDAMNKGAKMAKGNIVSFLNSDDYLADSAVLSSVAEAFVNNPGTQILYGDLLFRNTANAYPANESISYWKSARLSLSNLKRGVCIYHPASFVRINFFTKIGMFANNYKIAGDLDFFCRAQKINPRSQYLSKPLVVFSSSGKSSLALSDVERILVVARHFGLVASFRSFAPLYRTVFAKLLALVENKRKDSNLFWKFLVYSKDFFWFLSEKTLKRK